MGMKNRIAEAFTRDEPDILSRVLQDCPEKAAAPQRSRPIRKRAMEFIAAVAALAVTVTTVWSTVVYVMEQAPNGFWQQGGGPQSDGPGVPTGYAPGWEQPGTDAKEPVGETTPNGLVPPDGESLSMTVARDIALFAEAVYLDQVCCLKMWLENDSVYGVYFELDDRAREIYVDALTGEVISRGSVEEWGAPLCPSDTIGWEKARQIGLELGGKSLENMVGFTWDILSDPYAYRIELCYDDGSAISALLDAHTGEIVEPVDGITALQARDIALDRSGIFLHQVAILKMDKTSGYYVIYFDTGGEAWYFHIDSASGIILYEAKEEGGAIPQDDGYFGWQKARNRCLNAISRELEELIGFSWDISANPLAYWMELYFADGSSYYGTLDAVTGEFLGDSTDDPPLPEPDTYGLWYARDLALSMAGITLKEAREWNVLDNDGLITVTFETGEYAHRFDIDAQTGEILYDYGADHVGWRADEKMEHLVGWQWARDVALDACGRDISEVLAFMYGYWGDSYYVTLRFADDEFRYRIDAADGYLLEIDSDPPQGTIDTDKAVALALEYTGLTLEEVTELAVKLAEPPLMSTVPTYWVYFKHDGISYELCVNGFTGEVTLSMGAVDPQPDMTPEGDL